MLGKTADKHTSQMNASTRPIRSDSLALQFEQRRLIYSNEDYLGKAPNSGAIFGNTKWKNHFLVGGFNPFEKNILVKLDQFPDSR